MLLDGRPLIRLFFNLEVNDHSKNENCGEEVGQVGQVLAVEGFSQGPNLVLTGGQQVEQSNDSSLELC